MSLVPILKALLEAGATPAMLIAAVEGYEQAARKEDTISEKKERARQRVKRHRDKKSFKINNPVTPVTLCNAIGVTSSLPLVPPSDGFPHPSLTPPYNPPLTKKTIQKKLFEQPPEPDHFDIFWSHYPRKTGKKAAHLKFKIAAKVTDPQIIISAAARYSAERAAEDPNFTPHAATWLHGERWRDPPVSKPEPIAWKDLPQNRMPSPAGG